MALVSLVRFSFFSCFLFALLQPDSCSCLPLSSGVGAGTAAEGGCPFGGLGRANAPMPKGHEAFVQQYQSKHKLHVLSAPTPFQSAVSAIDFGAVKADIQAALVNSQAFWPADFGNYGPFLVRQAWHCAGSYRTSDGNGGCDGGRQRFEPERSWADNTNLDKAKTLLQPIKTKYGAGLSWGDLIIFAGTVAIQSMGGPVLGFCAGRVDDADGSASDLLGPSANQQAQFPCPINGQCSASSGLGATTIGLIYVNPEGPAYANGTINTDPAASAPLIRDTFGRMSMNDWETVALIGGGHAFGKTHGACPTGPGLPPNLAPQSPWNSTCGLSKITTSGFEGPWTFTPTQWSNGYFVNLLNNVWSKNISPAGHTQWRSSTAPGINMLTSDISLTVDPSYKTIVEAYAANITLLNENFAAAWYKLVTRDMGPVSRCVAPVNYALPPAQSFQNPLPEPPTAASSFPLSTVKSAIASALSNFSDPALFVQLTWSCACTFRATDYIGGCNGARIRFPPQSTWPVNANLAGVIAQVEKVQAQLQSQQQVTVSIADVIVLAGQVALESASNGLLSLSFCPGRSDASDGSGSALLPPQLWPNATIDEVQQQALVAGWSKRAVVALSGRPRSALEMGRLGYTAATFTATPSVFNNEYYVRLASDTWIPVTAPNGQTQYQSAENPSLYMLPIDLALRWDPVFFAVVQEYASNPTTFLSDFNMYWTNLVNADRFSGPTGNLCAQQTTTPTTTSAPASSSTTLPASLLVPAGTATAPASSVFSAANPVESSIAALDFGKVRTDIIIALSNSKAFWPADFGNYGPFFIRQAWHCAGSYRISDGNGGCDGARQRFDPERSWADNTNLDKAKTLLLPIKLKYGNALTWGDLIILTANVAIQTMGGPVLGFCAGRLDNPDGTFSDLLGPSADQAAANPCPINGQCEASSGLGPTTIGLIYVNPEGAADANGTINTDPAASAPQIRDTFGRMSMNDWETVALIGGGHAFGKTHGACPTGPGLPPNLDPQSPWNSTCGLSTITTSGFEGPWTFTPTQWSNGYFVNLLNNVWSKTISPAGHTQWRSDTAPGINMLTSDISLTVDPSYRAIVQAYAANITLLNEYFAAAWYKLTTRDMGPISRCISPSSSSSPSSVFPLPSVQPFQNPLPASTTPLPISVSQLVVLRALIVTAMTTPVAGLPQDNGSYASFFIQLAWQCASTFRATDYVGGCNGARIRFPPQSTWPINADMSLVLSILHGVQSSSTYPISIADLIVYAAQVALEESSKPPASSASSASLPLLALSFCGGRSDDVNGAGGALASMPLWPNATNAQIMTAMKTAGWTTRQLVAMFGRPRSAAEMGRWGYTAATFTATPSVFDNQYYVRLTSDTWNPVTAPNGQIQYQSAENPSLYMLPIDLALRWDPVLFAIVQEYAAASPYDYLTDFAAYWTMLVNADRLSSPSGNACLSASTPAFTVRSAVVTVAPTTVAPVTSVCPPSFPYQCHGNFGDSVCFNTQAAATACSGAIGSWCALPSTTSQIQSFITSGYGAYCQSVPACPASFPFLCIERWSSSVCFNTAAAATACSGRINSWCSLAATPSSDIAQFIAQGEGIACSAPQVAACPPSFPFLCTGAFSSTVCYATADQATACNGPIGSWCAQAGAPTPISTFVQQGYGKLCAAR